jgi:hypothetical protein
MAERPPCPDFSSAGGHLEVSARGTLDEGRHDPKVINLRVFSSGPLLHAFLRGCGRCDPAAGRLRLQRSRVIARKSRSGNHSGSTEGHVIIGLRGPGNDATAEQRLQASLSQPGMLMGVGPGPCELPRIPLPTLSEKSLRCPRSSPTGSQEVPFWPISCSAWRPNSRLERRPNTFSDRLSKHLGE